MRTLLKSAVFSIAIIIALCPVASAQPAGEADGTAGLEAPPPADAAKDVPVVRQSTPVPNDPESPRRPRPARVPSPAELASVLKPAAHRCFVRDVMSFYDRTHVRCYNRAQGKFSYFAVDTSQPVAETLLNKAWKSMRSGKPLTVKYAPTSHLNPTNCAARDCRRLLDVAN
jgi:hypothetical protein